jgi:hypothetical protein
LFPEAAPVSAHFRAAEAGFGWAAVLACSAEVHSLVPEVDFRELADEFRALVADSLARVDEQAVDFPATVVDFLELTAAFWTAEALACSLGVHCFALAAHSRGPVVDCRAQAAGSLALADEPEVELLVPAADFRAWVAALADSEEVHSLARGADFRELAAPSGSPEPARSRVVAVDCRVPLVSQVVQRSADLAALPAAFLLTVAVADWLALLQLCSTAALERALHSTQCETRSVWVSSGPRELLEPREPSSLRPVCLQAFPEAARRVSQRD